MTAVKRLGELLVENNIVSQDAINDALRVQIGGNRRLGHILLRMEALTEDQLTDTLSQQLNIPLTDPDETFSPEAKRLLPRYLCTKYGVLPLSLKKNNIMLTAMTDPSDQEAISDIEHYTDKVVEPCLSKLSDIERAIKRHVPYSIKDFFNPQSNTTTTRLVAATSFVMVIILGMVSYNYIQKAKYGSVSHVNNSTIYEHHDLMVGFKDSGAISLLGHGAFAEGFYSVSFADITTLKAFIAANSQAFSKEQKEWLSHVIKRGAPHAPLPKALAQTTR